MEITLLVKIIAGLIVVLSILIFLFIVPINKKAPEHKKVVHADSKPKPKLDLDSLRAMIKDKKATSSQLQERLDLVIKHHGKIHSKLGSRMHPDFDAYMEILFVICRHPNTTKDIILKFNRDLERLNPTYKQEINEAITKGLDSR